MAKPKKTQVVGLGWSGLFVDGTPGWFITPHVGGDESFRVHNDNMRGETFYRCEITVRLVKDSKGRFITRRAPGPERSKT